MSDILDGEPTFDEVTDHSKHTLGHMTHDAHSRLTLRILSDRVAATRVELAGGVRATLSDKILLG